MSALFLLWAVFTALYLQWVVLHWTFDVIERLSGRQASAGRSGEDMSPTEGMRSSDLP